jgi:hypothetical protein
MRAPLVSMSVSVKPGMISIGASPRLVPCRRC